jgi:hypothetical protein
MGVPKPRNLVPEAGRHFLHFVIVRLRRLENGHRFIGLGYGLPELYPPDSFFENLFLLLKARIRRG